MGTAEQRTRSQTWRGPVLGLAALVVVAPELLGGATDETALTIHVLACAASAAVAWRFRKSRRADQPTPLLGLGALFVAGWTLIQALPLPCSWIAWAQPARRELAEELVALGAIGTPRCSISASPGSTWAAWALASTFASLLLASAVAGNHSGRTTLLRAIATSALVMALVSLLHWAFGADEVFGLYAPVAAKPRLFLAPLLNENHLAGLMVLGFPACVALALSSSERDATMLWAAGAFLVFSTGLLSLSRGGAGALMLGGATFLVAELASRRERPRNWVPLAGAIGLLAVGLSLGIFLSYDLVAKEFRSPEDTFSKLDLVAQLSKLIPEHPWVGVGRGALGDVSTHVLLLNARALYTEDLPTQWMVEWGIPATLVLAATGLGSLLRWRWAPATSLEIAVACGLLALIAQNLVDFSLELPGVGSAAAIACGCLLAREEPPTWLRIPLRKTLTAATVLSVFATAVAVPWRTVWSKAHLTRELTASARHDAEHLPDALRAALGAYPLDPAFVLAGANLAVIKGRADAGLWLNLVMRRTPGWASPHLLAALALEQRGALDQAALELSIAGTLAENSTTLLACDFVKRHPSADLAWNAAEETVTHRQHALENLVHCLGQTPESEALASRVLEQYPRSFASHARLLMSALSRGDDELVRQRAEAMLAMLPKDPRALNMYGHALLWAKRSDEALKLIDDLPPPLRDSEPILHLEADIAAARRDSARLEAVYERLLTTVGRTAQRRADIHRRAASNLTTIGNFYGALAQAQSAYDLTGTPEDLELVHATALKAGSLPIALRTASELCQLRHRGETFCKPSTSRPNVP